MPIEVELDSSVNRMTSSMMRDEANKRETIKVMLNSFGVSNKNFSMAQILEKLLL